MFTELFIITKRLKQPKYSSTDEWLNKMCYTHKMEHYYAVQRDEALIPDTS